MQDWMILVLAIVLLGATFVVISRDNPRKTPPDYTWGSASQDEQDEQDDDENEKKTDMKF